MIDKINYLETETEKYPLVFTLNVMESIQEKYGTIELWKSGVYCIGTLGVITTFVLNKDCSKQKNPFIKVLMNG